jgi:hypothetical protein
MCEGGDEHLTKQAPIFMNGAEEPRDVEPAREVDQARPARHQHQVTIPRRLEFGPRHHGGTGRQRRLHQRLAVTDLAEQQETAVAQRHDCGHRRADKPLPSGQPRTRLEPKLLGAAQHLRNANSPPTEAMANLLGIGANTVETRQHHQRRKTWVSRIYVTGLCRH